MVALTFSRMRHRVCGYWPSLARAFDGRDFSYSGISADLVQSLGSDDEDLIEFCIDASGSVFSVKNLD